MKDHFDIASHLTYVVECIATDLTGEAKFELRKVIKELEASELSDKDDALEKLNEAAESFRGGDYEHAAICAVSANRLLQKYFVASV